MATITPNHSRNTPTRPLGSMTTKRHSVRVPTAIEKWDVVSWNDQVCSSGGSSGLPTDSTPRTYLGAFTAQPHSAAVAGTPSFATSASAFGFTFRATPIQPRAIPRRKSSENTTPCQQTRLDALSALNRSVEEHDESILARMRELEERCHLLPDSLSVPHSSDLTLSGAPRGRKRDMASWDDDGDVEMTSWNERRRKHRSLRVDSPPRLCSASTCDEKASHFDDDYVIANSDSIDSSSSVDEDEDDELDIVIVQSGGSSTSSPPSLSTSLSSLPPRSASPHLHRYTPLYPIPSPVKAVDELAAAMAGGAASVVEWSLSSDVSGDEDRYINPNVAQAGALWA